MNVVKIEYNLDKDLWNYDFSFLERKYPSYGREDRDYARFLPKPIKDQVSIMSDKSEKLEIIEDFLLKNFVSKELLISALERWLIIGVV